MNESFSDLSILGSQLQADGNALRFFNSLNENVIRGYALSSVFGGMTPNSEFEFLTGNTMAFMPIGSCPYMQYLRTPCTSLVSNLQNCGYQTIAMHPYESSGWARLRVYPDSLCFEKSYFLEDFPQKNLIRNYVSDQEMYEKMLNVYQSAAANGSVFLFGVTMQNHGGYDYGGFESKIHLRGYKENYPLTEQYLSVLEESDRAFEYLIHSLSSSNRKIVVCMFGDHLPKLEQSFFEEVHGSTFESLDDKQLQYTIPFVIWANYDIQEKEIPLTSLNYLSGYVSEAAGLELSPYQKFLRAVEEEIPAINANGYYSSQLGAFTEIISASGTEKEILEQYEVVQYNNMFDDKSKNRRLFPNP